VSPARPAARRPGSPAPRLAGMRLVSEADRSGRGVRIAIAASRFNERITHRLLDGALRALDRRGVRASDITVVTVPGAYELPFAARRLAGSRRYDAVLCLGAVIRGGTPHFEYVAGEAARGIAAASEATGIPVLFGVLTTASLRQALDRSGGRLGNRGADTAEAAVEMARLARALPASRGRA
jgi:6,7-dimethyl-8-ribityllumazine synthase